LDTGEINISANILGFGGRDGPGKGSIVQPESAVVRLVTVHPEVIPIIGNPGKYVVMPINYNGVPMELYCVSPQCLFFWSENAWSLL
jgi:hypothetical protein